jgi:hypothetical protein
MPVLQKIKKTYPTSLEVGVKYYALLSLLNNRKWKKREMELMAFTSLRGDIAGGGAKQQFVELVGTTIDTIGNLICQMSKKGLLVKEDKKIKVHPALQLDFSKEIILQLNLDHAAV